MDSLDLTYSSDSIQEAGSYRLLELPSELTKLIESQLAEENPGSSDISFKIKGNDGDDAVLCTANKTYTLRSVVLSNSVLVVSAPHGDESPDAQTVVIRDQLNEIMELVPTVPKLHKLTTMFKGLEYDDQDDIPAANDRFGKMRKITFDDLRSEVQASDQELELALKQKRILNVYGCLRPITQRYLSQILELLLNMLVMQSAAEESDSTDELLRHLEDEHGVSKDVVIQVMGWFGEVVDGRWNVHIDAVVKEIGLGILRNYKDIPIAENDLLRQWKMAVGDTYESAVSMTLLAGNFITSNSFTNIPEITYLPFTSLPIDPAARFGTLFLTRPRWKNDEIIPFLADIAVDSKERDKLLMKYARATTDQEGIWYTERAKYKG